MRWLPRPDLQPTVALREEARQAAETDAHSSAQSRRGLYWLRDITTTPA